MTDKQIRIDITSRDDASDTLADVADAVEKLEQAEPEVVVTADTTAASSDLSDVDALVEQLDKRAAAELEVTADTGTAEGDIKELGDTADTLTRGDHEIVLKAKIDAAKADLKTMQTELDDVRAAAKNAAGGMEGLDDVRLSKAAGEVDKVKKAARDVGTETDQTRSVVANFSGNVISEMPGVAGAFGPLNQAIGQFGEYAAEGNIEMGNLAKTAIPMAAVTVAVKGISDHFADIAATKAFNKDQVDAFAKSLREGADAAEAVTDALTEAGKVEIRLFDKSVDITGDLAAAGLSVEDFSELVAAGEPKIRAWGKAAKDAGVNVDVVDRTMIGATKTAENLATATEGAAAFQKVFGDNTEANNKELRTAADRVIAVKNAVDQYADKAKKAAERTQRLEERTERLDEAMGKLKDQLSFERTLNRFYQDFQEAFRKVNHGKDLTSEEILSLKEDVLDVADFAKLTPAEVRALLRRINRGDIKGVRDDVQAYMNEHTVETPAGVKYVGGAGDARNKAQSDMNNQPPVGIEAELVFGQRYYYQVTHPPNVNPGSVGATAAWPGGGAGGEVTNVHMYLPRGYRERDVIAAGRRAARRSGGLYRRTRR